VAIIHLALIDIFGKDNVSLEICDRINSDRSKQSTRSPHILEIALLDAVLNWTTKTPRVLTSGKATVDTPVKVKVNNVGLKDWKHNTRFRALVAVLPEAGVFFVTVSGGRNMLALQTRTSRWTSTGFSL
jgi:hypothetical protein